MLILVFGRGAEGEVCWSLEGGGAVMGRWGFLFINLLYFSCFHVFAIFTYINLRKRNGILCKHNVISSLLLFINVLHTEHTAIIGKETNLIVTDYHLMEKHVKGGL